MDPAVRGQPCLVGPTGRAEESQAEAAGVPKADGTDDRIGETQADHLTSAIPDEGALVRFSSRYVHRDPMRSSDELDLDIRREPSPLNLAADLL